MLVAYHRTSNILDMIKYRRRVVTRRALPAKARASVGSRPDGRKLLPARARPRRRPARHRGHRFEKTQPAGKRAARRLALNGPGGASRFWYRARRRLRAWPAAQRRQSPCLLAAGLNRRSASASEPTMGRGLLLRLARAPISGPDEHGL